MLSNTISVIINGSTVNQDKLITHYINCNYVKEIFVVGNNSGDRGDKKVKLISGKNFNQTATLVELAKSIKTIYALFLFSDIISIAENELHRLVDVADLTQSGLVYSDFWDLNDDIRKLHPTIDYQDGSLRDDFDFGKLCLIRTNLLKSYKSYIYNNYEYAAFYELRLFISRHSKIIRIPEVLYLCNNNDNRKSGEKQFDYVDPKNRDVQIEMEQVVTDHLRKINAFLEPAFNDLDFTPEQFPVIASVIIPVKDRVQTIGNAVKSALNQSADFEYNVLVIDNYSTDGTTELLCDLSSKHDNLIHYVPERKDLNIGGCWNAAANHPECGMFSVQLDSDDLYINKQTLQKIHNKFISQKCAMVIGTYTMTDFDLKTIPPGIIDHKEWTDDNGRNNGLRINGFGAPRAFYTPIIRAVGFPNTSYGEDYAVTLAISRKYKIGRIYESLYLCRRWTGNTDSDLTIEQVNRNNYYKDRIRTIEIYARQNMLIQNE